MPYTEEKYENAIIQLFEEMGYTHAYGPAIDRDYKTPLYMDELTEALYRLNPTLPDDAISDELFKLQNFENGELVQKNAVFMDYLQTASKSAILIRARSVLQSAILLTTQTRTTTHLSLQISGLS